MAKLIAQFLLATTEQVSKQRPALLLLTTESMARVA